MHVLASSETGGCTLLGEVTANGASPQDSDPSQAAKDRLRLLTLGKAGNAYLVRDFSQTTSPAGASVTVVAKVYSCKV